MAGSSDRRGNPRSGKERSKTPASCSSRVYLGPYRNALRTGYRIHGGYRTKSE